jgi:hypothetical protein
VYKLQVKTRNSTCTHASPRALQFQTLPSGLRNCHVSSGSGTHLPDRKGSGATMCIVAPDPLGGLWCAACPAASDLASLSGGLRATTCHAVPCGPRASNIKKSLTSLPVQLGSHVPNARTHICKTPDANVIMGLQDVWTSSAFNAYKTCRQTTHLMPTRRADRRLQRDYSAASGLLTTRLSPLQCQATRQHGVMLLNESGMAGRQDRAHPMPSKTSFATSSQ